MLTMSMQKEYSTELQSKIVYNGDYHDLYVKSDTLLLGDVF